MAPGDGRKKPRNYFRCSPVGFVTGLSTGLLVSSLVCYFLCRPLSKVHCEPENNRIREKQGERKEGIHTAHLLLNHTGSRQDNTLQWQGGPSLGRSFIYGLTLVKGSLQTQRSGIYGIYAQVTLAKCIQTRAQSTELEEVKTSTLTIGILSAQGRHSSLLRRHFQGRCSLSASLQVNLSHQDTLYVNLTYPLVPSPNADETFFGASWFCPPPPVEY
ncbi:CD70 antigen [Dromiciops gliroides]|uniref:CD70 antigen n=1 Tax=Dromiciops gliroides TaxID=33562 RepID=UPI001CC70821|nr:CD70 antigen [Dromiciops gliroides]